MEQPTQEEPQGPGFTPARAGDLALVLVGEHCWVLGEVLRATREGRVLSFQQPGQERATAVRPHHLVRVAQMDRMSRQRAFRLLLERPASWHSWEGASDYLKPAMLAQGEDSGDMPREERR